MSDEFTVVPGSLQDGSEEGHLSSRSVAALAHHESAGFDAAGLTLIREHVETCPACAARVDSATNLDATTSDLLQLLDGPAPNISARSVIARAQRRRRLSQLRAAAMVAAFGGAAVTAAALPASPFRGPILRMLETIVPTRKGTAATTAVVRSTLPLASQRGGIAVTPLKRLDVVFTHTQASGMLHLTIVDTPTATLSSVEASPSYEVGEDRITVSNARASGSYDLVIPRALRHVSVRIGTAVVFRRDGDTVTALVPSDAGGSYIISLAR
jgi:hypothetical protein